MKKIALIFLVSLFGFGLFSASQAEASPVPLEIFSFQLAGFHATNGESHTSGHLAWTPILSVGPMGVRGDFGVTHVKTMGEGNFVTNYQGFLRLSLLPMMGIEAGAGMETWRFGSSSNTDLLVTGNLFINIPAGPIDRIFGGYSRFFGGSEKNEFRLGIGLTL